MREEYEDSGFNPLKVGLIGAIVIAIVVAGGMYYRSFSENRKTLEDQQLSLQQDLDKARKENKALQEQLKTLEDQSKEAQSKFEKSLKLKDSQLNSTMREKDSENRSADARIAQITKDKQKAEEQAEQLKKDLDTRSQDLKKSQDQLAKLQTDLRAARTDADKYAKDAKVLQAKLNKINEGEEEAADQMIRQLAEARRQLKQEQATRQKLEQELDTLRQQAANPQ